MTFTEAAFEVLRRTGQPLHFKDIAQQAVDGGLLSHVGVTPEATMGARLLALARREHDRRIVATDTGVFGLAEWGIGPAAPELGEPTPEELAAQAGPPLRTRERHPEVREELVVGARREERRRGRGEEGDSRQRRKRYGPPAELAHQWLLKRGTPASLADIVAGLRSDDRVAEALERDLGSFEKALKEENRRRGDGGRTPMFEFTDDGLVKGLELPRDQPKQREQKPAPQQKAERVREEPLRVAAFDEQRRQVMRTVRRRLANLDVSGLERVVVALLEAQGYRELNMARRSAKDGPLYLARRKWGAGELRYAVRVLKPGRDLGRTEVQDLRKDVGHYSSQIGIVFGGGECSREAKSEGNVPGGIPVLLYGSEALAEALVEAGLGVRRRMVEWVDFDEEFFASVGGGEELPETEAAPPPTPPPAPPQQAASPLTDEMREERQRRREEQRARRGRRGEQEAVARVEAPAAEVSESTRETAVEPGPVEAVVVEVPVEAAVVEVPVEAAPVDTTEAAPVEPTPVPPETRAASDEQPASEEPVPPQD